MENIDKENSSFQANRSCIDVAEEYLKLHEPKEGLDCSEQYGIINNLLKFVKCQSANLIPAEIEALKAKLQKVETELQEWKDKYSLDIQEVNARADMVYWVNDELTAELEQYRKQEADVPNCWCCSQVKNIQIFFRGQRMASPKHCPECGKQFQEDKQPESYQEK